MPPSTPVTILVVLALLLLSGVLASLLVAAAAAFLALKDGASRAGALLRAGITFGGSLTLITAIIAMCISAASK